MGNSQHQGNTYQTHHPKKHSNKKGGDFVLNAKPDAQAPADAPAPVVEDAKASADKQAKIIACKAKCEEEDVGILAKMENAVKGTQDNVVKNATEKGTGIFDALKAKVSDAADAVKGVTDKPAAPEPAAPAPAAPEPAAATTGGGKRRRKSRKTKHRRNTHKKSRKTRKVKSARKRKTIRRK